MTRIEEQELLELTRQNNDMLRQIIFYINCIEHNANSENVGDFIRNILANLFSNKVDSNVNRSINYGLS